MPDKTSVHILSDGVMKMDGGVLFGQVPKGQWQEWLPADRRNRVKIGLNCLLVQTGDKTFLIDSGIGQKHSPDVREYFGMSTSQLLSSLKKYGYQPTDIDGVILTSLHFEHSGGATRVDRRGDLVPTFPKAQYFVHRKALKEAMEPNERDSEGYVANDFVPLQQKGLLDVLDDDSTVVTGIQIRHASGPTEGHQIAIITHGGERIAFLGDIVPTPYHLHLSCISSLDRAPEETLNSKRRLLSEASAEGWLLVFCHGLTERAGYLENRNGKHYLRTIDLP
jgi:glyoxylase-like metal-dependent hydrolase (beta-lactamase superfamily II)